MTKSQIIERIEALSDEDMARVAPYLEADLDALADADEVREEIRKGRASAATEALVDDDEVVETVLRQLSGRA
jgi:hypothetical protein